MLVIVIMVVSFVALLFLAYDLGYRAGCYQVCHKTEREEDVFRERSELMVYRQKAQILITRMWRAGHIRCANWRCSSGKSTFAGTWFPWVLAHANNQRRPYNYDGVLVFCSQECHDITMSQQEYIPTLYDKG